jgi:hypothetical protein
MITISIVLVCLTVSYGQTLQAKAQTLNITRQIADFTDKENQVIVDFTDEENQGILDFTDEEDQKTIDFLDKETQIFDFTDAENKKMMDFTDEENQQKMDFLVVNSNQQKMDSLVNEKQRMDLANRMHHWQMNCGTLVHVEINRCGHRIRPIRRTIANCQNSSGCVNSWSPRCFTQIWQRVLVRRSKFPWTRFYCWIPVYCNCA